MRLLISLGLVLAVTACGKAGLSTEACEKARGQFLAIDKQLIEASLADPGGDKALEKAEGEKETAQASANFVAACQAEGDDFKPECLANLEAWKSPACKTWHHHFTRALNPPPTKP